MKRLIKFEYGFDSVNGIIKKVYELHEIPNIKEKCDVWGVLPIKYVRQFTGLTDKNGREVYDGDIVSDSYEGIYTIRFIDCNCHLIDKFGDKYIYNNSKNHLLSIVGNTHENPELL